MAEIVAKREREDGADELVDSFSAMPSEPQKLRVSEDRKPQRWTPEEDEVLRIAVEKHGQRNWKLIAAEVEGRNHGQCQQRWNKVLKPGLVKGHWSEEEDAILRQMALQGCPSWTDVAAQIPGRTPKQCRERWRNHLDPSINRAPFTPEEDCTIQQAYEKLGNRWTKIAELVPGRTEDAVKTRWKTLNPFRKTNDRPGRPRRLPGVDEVNPEALVDDGPLPIAYSSAYNALASMLLSALPANTAQPPAPTFVADGSAVPGTDLPEPIVEPLNGVPTHIDSKDAAILRELLLRSHSSSVLSFGSGRDINSFSPDELLGSGELDEMLKAVSISNDSLDPNLSSGLSSGSTSKTTAQALFKKLKDLSELKDFSASQDKHIFQELIDAVRTARGESAELGDDSNRSLDIFATDSGQDLLHSLDFDRTSIRTTSVEVGALEGYSDDDEDDDNDDDDDLLKPIHIGKRSASTDDGSFSDLLKPIHLGKRTSFVGSESTSV